MKKVKYFLLLKIVTLLLLGCSSDALNLRSGNQLNGEWRPIRKEGFGHHRFLVDYSVFTFDGNNISILVWGQASVAYNGGQWKEHDGAPARVRGVDERWLTLEESPQDRQIHMPVPDVRWGGSFYNLPREDAVLIEHLLVPPYPQNSRDKSRLRNLDGHGYEAIWVSYITGTFIVRDNELEISLE